MKKINPKKTLGADNWTAKEMKIAAEEITNCLTNISKLSFQDGNFPSQWKVGKVKALWKTENKQDCINYRPITLLSIPSKVTESIICDNIDEHLNTVIHENQWGYRKGISTNSLLLYITELWKMNLDKKNVIGAIFIDFRKAFDSVDHTILNYKMDASGLYGNLKKWLQSYLTNRQQFVEINGKKSGLHIVPYGVPQGSLLGPRLFSIYVLK